MKKPITTTTKVIQPKHEKKAKLNGRRSSKSSRWITVKWSDLEIMKGSNSDN